MYGHLHEDVGRRHTVLATWSRLAGRYRWMVLRRPLGDDVGAVIDEGETLTFETARRSARGVAREVCDALDIAQQALEEMTP